MADGIIIADEIVSQMGRRLAEVPQMAMNGTVRRLAGRGATRPAASPNRRARAKARTRSALIGAAQRFIVEGRLHAPVLELTQAADVGLGSFYNHFQSREALFAAATDDALDALGAVLDQRSARFADPAEAFTQSFRLFGRLLRREPLLMQVALSGGAALIGAQRGLVPRARRDLQAGIRRGRFTVRDIDVALGIVVGTTLCLGELLREQPRRDEGATTDAAAEAVLRGLGIAAEDANRLVAQPLPDLDLGSAGIAHTPAPQDTRRERPQRQQPSTADTLEE